EGAAVHDARGIERLLALAQALALRRAELALEERRLPAPEHVGPSVEARGSQIEQHRREQELDRERATAVVGEIARDRERLAAGEPVDLGVELAARAAGERLGGGQEPIHARGGQQDLRREQARPQALRLLRPEALAREARALALEHERRTGTALEL